MVEIGPGPAPDQSAAAVAEPSALASKIDRDIIARLHKTHPAEKLTVHGIDALKSDFGALGDAAHRRQPAVQHLCRRCCSILAEYGERIR